MRKMGKIGKIILAMLLIFAMIVPTAAPASAAGTLYGVPYITPEDYGAKGDGVTDDSAAFEKCMKSTSKYILLTKTYLVKRYLTANTEKYFYAIPKNGGTGATIICNPKSDTKCLAFTAGVTFENIELCSDIVKRGTSPHGETYQRTSNVVLTEVWNTNGTFINCSFLNALTAIRGRKSSSSTVIPANITVDGCTFYECKSAVQGYCKTTNVKNSLFVNNGELFRQLDKAAVNVSRYNGDLFSGDHCIYIERYGCSSLTVDNCDVVTENCTSGASFQIYGTPKSGDSTPSMLIKNSTLRSNCIATASAANITIQKCTYNAQRAGEYIVRSQTGSINVVDSELTHAYAFCYTDTNVKPVASGCTFRLNTALSTTRCNFPLQSVKCTYINWGGNVKAANTVFSGCTFTFEGSAPLNELYVSNSSGYKVAVDNTRFKNGPTLTNNVNAVTKYVNSGTF